MEDSDYPWSVLHTFHVAGQFETNLYFAAAHEPQKAHAALDHGNLRHVCSFVFFTASLLTVSRSMVNLYGGVQLCGPG